MKKNICVFVLSLFVFIVFSYKIAFLFFLLNLISFIFLNKKKIKFDKKIVVFTYILSIFLNIGYFLNNNNDLNIIKCLLSSMSFIYTFYVLFYLFDLVIEKLLNQKLKEEKELIYFIKTFIFIFICWFLVFLAYYPGIFGYDVVSQIEQGKTGVYSTIHPLLHTLLLNWFYNLFSNNHSLGIALYTIIQMLFLDFAISYELLFIYKYKKTKLNLLATIYFSLLPVFSILSISVTKDIFFTAFFIIFITLIFNFKKDNNKIGEKKYIILFIISSIGVALFRNNGFYVIVIGNLFYMLLNKTNKQVITISLLSFCFVLLIPSVLKLSTRALSGPKNEMLSIPYQQIARVDKYEKVPSKDKKVILKIIPNSKNYKKYISDPIKGSAKGMDYLGDFTNIYFKLFINYPTRYVEAFIYNNMGYLYIFDTSNANIYGSGLKNRQGYLLTDIKPGYSVYHKSYFPFLEQIYEKLFSDNEYQNNIILFMLCSFSLYFWIIIYCMVKSLIKSNLEVCIYLIIYFLTMFLGPCALIRYALPYVSILPIIVFNTYNKE